MRLTEIFHFLYSGEKIPIGGYKHFDPTPADYRFKKQLQKEKKKKRKKVMKEFF